MGDTKDNYKVFPLSPDPSLRKNSDKVYFSFLKDALEGSEINRIHNIAISGGFGTGKSSLIRSYESYKQQLCVANSTCNNTKNNSKFLYVSVGEYASTTEGKGNQQDNTTSNATLQNNMFLLVNTHLTRRKKGISRTIPLPGNAIVKQYDPVDEHASDTEGKGNKQNNDLPRNDLAKQKEETTSIRAIERRLLLQIFARFRRADLPQSSFRLIPEAWTKRLWLIAVLLGCFVFSALLLCFHEQLGALLVAVDNMEGGGKCGTQILAFLMKYKTLFRLVLSAYCIGFGALASAFLCIRILPRIRFRAFTVKGASAELSLEREAAESYLDLYSMELVYCLEKLAKKIDYVVVFEDLDRLYPHDCLYIITRLREINNLVNLRLQRNGKPLRFIYAVNDEFLGSVQHEKFFDYILPVIPEMNSRSAAILFADKIKDIDGGYDVSHVFPQFDTVASCLSDYRLQNTILNEYQVLKELYTATNAKMPKLNDPQKNEILAFAIYKNCWPGDYHAIRADKSQVFSREGVKCPEGFKDGKYGSLLVELADPNNHLLTLHSLYYIGFCEEELSKRYQSSWAANVEFSKSNYDQYLDDLNLFREGDTNCIEEAGLFLIRQITLINQEELNSDVSKPFRGLIACVVRCKYRENNWFTRRNQDSSGAPFFSLMRWLELLSKLTDDGDEGLKNNFTSLFQVEGSPTKTLFCDKDELNALKLSKPMLKELCRAIPKFPKSTCFIIEDNETPNPEESDEVIKIRAELASAQ